MRKQSLRQTANRYLKTDNRGSFKDKKHRAFVIHKMIDDLFMVGDVPSSWHTMNSLHLQNLMQHWHKQKIQPATMMRYMTIIRTFLKSIECQFTDIDNQSLGLTRQYRRHKKAKIQSNIWQTISEPSARLIMALQTQFGLTFGEAIRFIPEIHFSEHSLWITREIAFNSEDRMIPLRHDFQKAIIADFSNHTQEFKCLLQQYGYETIRYQWSNALAKLELPTNKSYRYLYAQQLKKELSLIIGNYKVSWLIRDEMGIKSRNTLWLYLNE